MTREEAVALRNTAAAILVANAPAPDASPDVAPGLATLGFMLPSTPLHHLLFRDIKCPLVMTNSNLSDEDEALQRRREVTEHFLLHDPPIARRVDRARDEHQRPRSAPRPRVRAGSAASPGRLRRCTAGACDGRRREERSACCAMATLCCCITRAIWRMPRPTPTIAARSLAGYRRRRGTAREEHGDRLMCTTCGSGSDAIAVDGSAPQTNITATTTTPRA